ncbi:hypothetical protein PTSG_09027 [Salpingoeca rosetta]|uniref:RNA helicase n=1 Tax=Salpingoeca rosetta (strain ATCC 50818 / BSB-021) TaxID=946362 RepID=F2UM02_SALR5|nr:uncharacterized protein PTSG_09027 [Salpingoeca rosetta]EGD78151.1 hypothetical protein PTSG_09027 [Salpingoeca rosetta]|eukprot:XP_004989827.1 hypothetical protein PTSG_09027 [Salpingoeca rosetta]
MPPKRKKHIQRTGNAGNSKKGSKEEVMARLAQKKAQQEASKAATGDGGDDGGGFAIWGSSPADDKASSSSSKPKPIALRSDLSNWTGKRPQTLLYELCRQRKYSKPSFRPIPRDGGFICKINLFKTDPKSGEQENFYTCDKRVYSTKEEAVNMNAVACLHRINFDKPMHRVLPPGYRDYWLKLEDERKADPRSKAPRSVDPFKFKKEVEQRREKREVDKRRRERTRELDPKFSYPSISIAEDLRHRIEAAIKKVMVYSEQHGLAEMTAKLELAGNEGPSSSSSGGRGGGGGGKGRDGSRGDDQKKIVADLQKQGFLRANIEEALLYCKSRSAVLDWLCLHLPERDLPEQYRPVIMDVRTHTRDTAALAHEYRIRRLVDYGFKREHSEALLLESGERVFDALARLLANLHITADAHAHAHTKQRTRGTRDGKGDDTGDVEKRERFVREEYPFVVAPPDKRTFDPELEEQLHDEISSMQAIFEGQCHVESAEHNGTFAHTVRIDLKNIPEVPGKVSVHFFVPVGCHYPAHRPLIVVTSDKLPAHVALTMTKDANIHAKDFVGDVMMNDIASWLELHAPDYVENPPRLADLPTTRLLFCTTGVLLRQLQSDPAIHSISHIFVDEVHERSLDSDVLLARLRDVLRRRKDLKVVLMSATLDAAKFSNYFGGAPVIQIPGFTHPVKEVYLEDIYATVRPRISLPSAEKAKRSMPWTARSVAGEDACGVDDETLTRLAAVDGIDYQLIADIVQYILQHGDDGAILIFMPGMGEITRAIKTINSKCGGRVTAMPLHSSLTAQEQARIFSKAPSGMRKVIVSTNIAETSITVDDVTHVIDSGKMKENRYDAGAGMELLVETWVSRASAQQRRGRAGRVKPGTCYRCFSRRRFAKMADQQAPEVLRVPLEHLCLHIKSIGYADVTKFLSGFLDSPDASTVDQALSLLHDIGALDAHGHITALGHHLAQFPLGTRLAKLILFGAILKCVDPVVTIAACIGYKPIFVSPMDRRDEANAAKERFKTCASDHITIVNAFNAAVEVLQTEGRRGFMAFCSDNFLSHKTIMEVIDLRVQYYSVLQELGFAPSERQHKKDKIGPPGMNVHSGDEDVVMAAVFAGLYPNVVRAVLPTGTYTKVEGGTVRKDDEAKAIRLFPKETGRLFFHPSSILFHHTKFPRQYLVYTDKVKTSKVFIRDVSLVSTCAALLFSSDIEIDHDNGLLLVDDWMKFRASARVGVLASKLKAAFEALLAIKLEDPHEEIEKSEIFDLFCRLIKSG